VKKTASLPVTVAADYIALRATLDMSSVAMGYDSHLVPMLFWYLGGPAGGFRASSIDSNGTPLARDLADLNYPVTLVGPVSADVLDYGEKDDDEGAPDLLLMERAPLTLHFERISDDPELAAMEITSHVLGGLDQRARHRAVRWLAAREGI
jgi:hypothetical protein